MKEKDNLYTVVFLYFYFSALVWASEELAVLLLLGWESLFERMFKNIRKEERPTRTLNKKDWSPGRGYGPEKMRPDGLLLFCILHL